MRLMLIGRQKEKLLNAMVFPFGQKLVQGPVKGLPVDSGGAGVTLLSGIPDSVIEAGRQEDPAPPGDLSSHHLYDEGVGPEGEVRPMLDQRPNGEDEARIPGQYPSYFRPGEVVKGP